MFFSSMITLALLQAAFQLAVLAAPDEAPITYPLGVHLGPTRITVAQATGENQAKPLFEITDDTAYQAYYQSTIDSEGKRIQQFAKWYIHDHEGKLIPAPPENHDTLAVLKIFNNTLSTVLSRAQSHFNSSAKLGQITQPRHFNRTSVETLLEACQSFDTSFNILQIKDYLNMARLAYSLDSCEAFGHDPPCDLTDYDIILVFIELTDDQLTLYETYATEYFVEIQDKNSVKELGAGHFSSDTWSDSLLKSTIHDFFENLHSNHRVDLWPFIHGIVILSDTPSTDAIDNLRKVVRDVVPKELRAHIKDSVDPNYVAAVGAAHRARAQVQDPNMVDIDAHVEVQYLVDEPETERYDL